MRSSLLASAIGLLTGCGLLLVVLTACTLLLEVGRQTALTTAALAHSHHHSTSLVAYVKPAPSRPVGVL